MAQCPPFGKGYAFHYRQLSLVGTSFYTIGLCCYDLLAGRLGLGRSLPLSKKQTLKELPGLLHDHLRGGVVYHDGQFDDSRMAITLMQSAHDHGAICINYSESNVFD